MTSQSEGAEAPPPPPRLEFKTPVTLVGGGAIDWSAFHAAQALARTVIAADGGANMFRAEAGLFGGASPLAAVIGDMDSVLALEDWRRLEDCDVIPIAEQDTTDLQKCLYTVEAPLYLGVGFLGRRFDHSLAAAHALLAYAHRRVVLISAEDVVFLAPQHWRATLAPDDRVSIYPLRHVRGVRSSGLRWPIDNLAMEAGAQIGTSNAAAASEVAAEFDRVGALIILDRNRLGAAIESLTRPAPA